MLQSVRLSRWAQLVAIVVVVVFVIQSLVMQPNLVSLQTSSKTNQLTATWRHLNLSTGALTPSIVGTGSSVSSSPINRAANPVSAQQTRQPSLVALTNAPLVGSATPTNVIGADSNETTDNPNLKNAGHEITKILNKFFKHGGYDKRVRPNYSGPPAMVNVSFHIIGISSVSEVQMDFTTDFYFRQKWYDPRLEFKPVDQIDELCVGAEFADKIWLPDTFFANEKTATFHKATTENTFIRVAHNGRVYRSIRLTVTCSCPMDLQYFPMDRQRCKIEIESYGYNTRDIDYRWERGNESVSLDGKIELPQFKVLGFKMGHELQSLSSGDYIRLYCEIHFVRSMGYYLIQIYIPASLIVIISWVSFWLHRNATPARVALGVTTVLTMTTLMSSTNAALPKISYIKSIDVFLGTCFVMVFASLLEYASVGYIGKRIAMKRKRQQDLKQMEQHHARICVAAAASARAAAHAAREANPVGVANDLRVGSATQTLGRRLFNRGGAGASNKHALVTAGSAAGYQLVQRRLMSALGQGIERDNMLLSESEQTGSGLRQFGSKVTPLDGKGAWLDNSTADPLAELKRDSLFSANTRMYQSTSQSHLHMPQADFDTPKAASMPPQYAGLNNQNGPQQHQVTQRNGNGQDVAPKKDEPVEVVRICGLTPSAIDKYSRVVFPICFACFNLMYWIIYGHISQQMDDKGPPLILFVRS